jgi:hypothetical protein
MVKNKETRIVFVGPERWQTYSVFNGNAFPNELEAIVEACSTRLALVFLHISELHEEIERDKKRFRDALERQRKDLATGLSRRADLLCVGYYDGLGYIAAMHGCLASIKSFFDVYAQLMGKLIVSGANCRFKRATVDGESLSGGSVINWLRQSAPAAYAQSGALASLTLNHSREWITQAVEYRDRISHCSDIDGMKHMHLQLYPKDPPYDICEMVPPKMPDSKSVTDYFSELQERLVGYVKESIVLLPKVDRSLISLDRW